MIRLPTVVKRFPPLVNAYKAMLRVASSQTHSFVFVATTGRSGSDSLSRIFTCVEDAISLHEPYPVVNQHDIATRSSHNRSLDQLFDLKKIYIYRAAIGHRLYIETNHQFVKTFADVAAQEFGGKLRVVHLVRDPVSVATSFYRIGSIPGKSERGRAYLLDPFAKDNHVNISERLARESGFNRDMLSCLWYWYEIEARTQNFRDKFPDVPVFTLRTEELNNFDAIQKMFEVLRIEVDKERVGDVVGTRVNKKSEEKTVDVNADEVIRLDAQIREHIAEAHDGH